MKSCIARGTCLILAPVLVVLGGSLPDLAWAKQKIACDFVTGAGKAHAREDGGTLSFGLASGVAHGALWGHLVYLDDGRNKLTVESTGITNYVAKGPATRVIEGTARTNLYGDRRYRVTVTVKKESDRDHRGSGQDDAFQIELDNGYSKHATRFTGSVELLQGNLNSTPPTGFTCDQHADKAPKGRAPQ